MNNFDMRFNDLTLWHFVFLNWKFWFEIYVNIFYLNITFIKKGVHFSISLFCGLQPKNMEYISHFEAKQDDYYVFI